MDLTLVVGVAGTLLGALLGFLATIWTSRTNLTMVKLQGDQQHQSQMQQWRIQQLARSYEEFGQWLTSLYHAVHDLQLRETWRNDDEYPDFETEIRSWEQGPLRLPDTVAATRVSWSYEVRHAEVRLRATVEEYIAIATDRSNKEDWLVAMYDGLDDILVMIDRMMIRMREEIYGSDPTLEIVQMRQKLNTGSPDGSGHPSSEA